MILKIKKLLSVICILTLLFTIQIPVQAAVVDEEEVGVTYYDSTTNLSASYGGLTSYPKTELDFYTNYLPARDQGSTSLCWAYAAMASLETLMIKNGDGSIVTKNRSSRLSPVHMGAATRMPNMPEKLAASSARVRAGAYRKHVDSGAGDDVPIAYFTSWRGPTNETIFKNDLEYDDPIVGYDFESSDANTPKIVGVNGLMYLDGLNYENNPDDAWNDINNKKHRDTIKTAIYNYGSVVGSYFHLKIGGFNASTSAYYNDGVLPKTTEFGGYHAIQVIGWDDNYSKSNFLESAQPKNNGAWLCKNSWNISWGQQGCFWISYEDRFLFSKSYDGVSEFGDPIYLGGGYAFVNYQKIDDNVKLYQNTTCCPDIDLKLNKATYINVFDIDSDYTVLKKINFETTSQGSAYSIYYIPLDSSSVPNPDQSTWKKLCSGTTGYCGYISANIRKGFNIPKENSNKFAIGIKFLDYDTAIGYYTEGHPEANSGNSYITFNDENISASNSNILNQTDLCINKVSEVNNLYKSNAFVIKAVATKSTEPKIIKGDVDGDGIVTINDVTYLQRYLAEFINELSEDQKKAADTNGDGFITIRDATKIQRVLAEFETFD